ncbi:tetratricopeptide repeat protein [Halorhodospira halophila]|uniref:Tetratricopeptide TPR_2 repeat protein n=1 Tax=Halorhodospira halophila (strain DSM 244 / SL1) TaxID=349124 RepID=A1WTV9_HALHL|nr:tetratricopeptide repeat protein [Halorhodospira halophila]ABM61121.1 Tetratricopeptide TPR_2 repeat protein [Halorhodospira halophila SL1]MBK1730162.1 hypothetical protein [Halorhodospira halophila]
MSLINEVLRQAAEREKRPGAGDGDAGVQAAFSVARKPPRRRRWLAATLAGTVVVAAVGGSAYWLLAERDTTPDQLALIDDPDGAPAERPDDVTRPEQRPAEAVVNGLLEERTDDPQQWLVAAGVDPDPPAAPQETAEAPPPAAPTAVAAAQTVAADAVAEGRAQTAPVPEEDAAEPLGALVEEAAAEAESAAAPEAAEAQPEPPAETESRGTFVREPSRPDGGARADSLIQQAETHQRAGDTLSASQSYRRALEMDPDRHEARVGYARMLARAQRTERARGVLQEGLERAPEHERMARLYAHLSEERGQPQDGIDALEPVYRAQEGEPGAVAAHLAALYRQTGAHDQALMLYSELAEAEPDNGLWQAGIAVAAEQMGDHEGALRAWEQAREREGLSAEVQAHAEARIEALQGR